MSSAEFTPKYRFSRWAIAAILLIAATIGIFSVYGMHSSPFAKVPILDERSYVDWGMRVAAGEIINDKPFYQEALYPYFLGLCFFLFNKSLLAARLVQVGFWVLAVWFLYLTGRRLFGEREGLLAALLLSLYGVMYLYVAVLIKAALVVFTTTLFMYLLASAGKEKLKHWFWLGLVMGLLMNLRGNFILFIPFLFLWAWLVEWKGGRGVLAKTLKRGVLLVAGIVLALLPTTIHNYLVSGELIVTTSQGGANFYIGNSQYADGSMMLPYFVRADPMFEADDFAREAEKRTGQKMSPAEISRFWFKEGGAFLLNNPEAGARLMMRKLRYLVSNYEIPDNYSFIHMRRFFMPVLWGAFVGLGSLLGLAVAGMWFAWRRNSFSRPLVLFAAVYSVSLVLFYMVSRYRIPLVPAVILFASFYIMQVVDDLKGKKVGRHLLPVGVALLIGFFSFMPNDKSTETAKDDGEFMKTTGIVLMYQQRYQEALQFLQLTPMQNFDPDAMFLFGMAYEGLGLHGEALNAYSRSLQLHPGDQRTRKKIAELRKKFPSAR